MNKLEQALKIIDEYDVDVGLLKECFSCPDDPFLLRYEPDMCAGLYRYNRTYASGKYWRTPLNIKQYNLLKEVLHWRS